MTSAPHILYRGPEMIHWRPVGPDHAEVRHLAPIISDWYGERIPLEVLARAGWRVQSERNASGEGREV